MVMACYVELAISTRYGSSCSATKGPRNATLRLQSVHSNWFRKSSIRNGAVWHQQQV